MMAAKIMPFVPAWSSPEVIKRVAEAWRTVNAMPNDHGPAGSRSGWPEIVREYSDAVLAEDGRVRMTPSGKVLRGPDGTALTHWAPGFSRAAPLDRFTLDRSYEVLFAWLPHLGGRQDLVDALWFCHGRGLAPTEAARAIHRKRQMSRRLSRETVRRRRDLAVEMIVSALNK